MIYLLVNLGQNLSWLPNCHKLIVCLKVATESSFNCMLVSAS